jgi:hypothetical protein
VWLRGCFETTKLHPKPTHSIVGLSLQVELAMAEYQLPRLTRMWSHLERQAGGGQSKGMGETQMEVDKRLLRERIGALKTELESVRVHRAQYRTRRAKVRTCSARRGAEEGLGLDGGGQASAARAHRRAQDRARVGPRARAQYRTRRAKVRTCSAR